MLGVVILQDISQCCNRLGRRPGMSLRAEHSRWKRWDGKQCVKFVVTTGSIFNGSHCVWNALVTMWKGLLRVLCILASMYLNPYCCQCESRRHPCSRGTSFYKVHRLLTHEDLMTAIYVNEVSLTLRLNRQIHNLKSCIDYLYTT